MSSVKDALASRQAEKEYLRRSKSNNWERLKPFAPPGHTTTLEGLHLIQDFGACLALLDPAPHHRILDLGAGGGWASDWLQRLGFSVVATDLSSDLLEIACHRLTESGKAHVACADAETLPFRTSSFDRVLCMNTMHHLPHSGKVLREIARVLNADGRAVFAEPGMGHSRQPHAIRAVQEFGVQEADIDAAEFLDQCKAAGLPFVVIEPFTHIAPGYGLTAQHWRNWRKLAAESRPRRAARTLRRAMLELVGARKNSDLFAEAFSSTILRVLGAAMQDHPIIVASKQPLDRFLARTENPLLALNASIRVVNAPEVVRAGETVCLQVEIQNTGRMTWIANARIRGHVRVGAQLLDNERRLIDRDYARQPITYDVPTGHTVSTNMLFKAPSTPGWYFLKVDLVSEGVSWFEPHGSTATLHRLHVGETDNQR
jgi:2-polyprenyl-3-methyl-5-hydroxy-6-metoxy-1,4-benzoquinol methylase